MSSLSRDAEHAAKVAPLSTVTSPPASVAEPPRRRSIAAGAGSPPTSTPGFPDAPVFASSPPPLVPAVVPTRTSPAAPSSAPISNAPLAGSGPDAAVEPIPVPLAAPVAKLALPTTQHSQDCPLPAQSPADGPPRGSYPEREREMESAAAETADQNKKPRTSGTLPRHSGPSLLTQALASARGIPGVSSSSSSSSGPNKTHTDQQRTAQSSPPSSTPPETSGQSETPRTDASSSVFTENNGPLHPDELRSVTISPAHPLPAVPMAPTATQTETLPSATTARSLHTSVPQPFLTSKTSSYEEVGVMSSDRRGFEVSRTRGSSLEGLDRGPKDPKSTLQTAREHLYSAPPDDTLRTPTKDQSKKFDEKDEVPSSRPVHNNETSSHRSQKGPEKIWSIGPRDTGDGEEDGQVEKSVTEAMKGAEPNARSRKASYSLRFFREGLPKGENTRRKDTRHAAPHDLLSPTEEHPPQAPALSPSISVEDFAKSGAPFQASSSVEQTEVNFGRPPRSRTNPLESPEVPVLSESPPQDYFGLRKTHGRIFDETAEARTARQKDDGNKTPSTTEEDVFAVENNFNNQRRGSDESTEIGDSPEEGDESGEEKISSAVFVPHQGPDESSDADNDVAKVRHTPGPRAASRGEDFHPWLVKADEPEPDDETPDEKGNDAGPLRVALNAKNAKVSEHEVRREEARKHPTPAEDGSRVKPTLQAEGAGHEQQSLHPHEEQVGFKEEQPLEAIELIPYRHQVGGHTTIWRFSRRAVCKQLNNRENEFYEKVERHHRDLLTFLPRYIGVLNVTFHKQPRRKSIHKRDEAIVSEARPVDESGTRPPPEPNASHPVNDVIPANPVKTGNEHRRIISQSLAATQIPIPTVTFDDNRHILPRNLLQPTPPPVFFSNRYRSTSESASDLSGIPNKASIERPTLDDRHANSWGATTVNKRLRNEVFNDAFLKQPIPIHKHRRPFERSIPLRMHQTLRPATSDSSMLARSSVPDDEVSQRPHTEGNIQTRNAVFKFPPQKAAEPPLSSHRRVGDDGDDSVEDVTGTSAPEQEILANKVLADKKKRRYSGSALRRKPKDVSDPRGHLKYWEQADEPRAKDLELKDHQPCPLAVQVRGQAEEPETKELKDEHEAPVEGDIPPSLPFPASPTQDFQKIPRPINPKEAQTQAKDSRAEFFLLLEDLTAGMKRPCIMDLKMGTRQYGVDATPKKKKSQQGKCARTTSRALGVRVCGLQVWDVRTQSYVFKDKYFGRDLRAGREFQDALTRFLYDGLDLSSILRHIPVVLSKLDQLESIVRDLDGYRFYAASLLMFYDGDTSPEPTDYDTVVDDSTTDFATDTEETSALRERRRRKKNKREIDFKIADFANSLTKGDLAEDKPCPPRYPDEPDWGFVRGLRTLRKYFLNIQREIRTELGLAGARGQNGALAADFDLGPLEDEGPVSD